MTAPPGAPAAPPALSIVVPVHDEAAVLVELVERCRAAAAHAGGPWELVVVDDASTDGTRALAARWADRPEVRFLHLPSNLGQLGATLAGLAAARGDLTAVLDGDLQDPPEVLPALAAALRDAPAARVAFAVKATRDDPAWVRAGSAALHALQRAALARPVPRGAGSYCLFPGDLARALGASGLRDANLGALLVALGLPWVAVPYAKAARYDGRSRVGAWRLAREALGSLALTGALERLLAAAALLGAALLLAAGAAPAAAALAAAGLAATLATAARRRRVLRPLRRAAAGAPR